MPKKVYAPGLIALLSAICLASLASAQTSWWKTYGGTGDEESYSVQQTTGGGYVVAGYTRSFGAGPYDVYLIKTNDWGDTLWTKTYGGANSDQGHSVRQTTDGGYIIVGYTNSYGAGVFDVYLIKTNPSGDTLWTRTYGGTDDDYGFSVQQTSDGGYIIVGSTISFGGGTYYVYLIKTNAAGDTLWTRTYGGKGETDEGHSVRQTTDGGYIVAGNRYSLVAEESGMYLIKTNAFGDTLWTRFYVGTSADGSNSVLQTTDGGYVIAGGGYNDVYLLKVNSFGDTLWTRTYGGPAIDRGYSLQQTSDGGYIIAGMTYSFVPTTYDSDVYLVRTDVSGETLWTRAYGETNDDMGYSVQQTSGGGFIIAGYTRSFGAGGEDVYLIKTDSLGNVGVAEPLTKHPASPIRFLVQPSPFTSFACVPGHETELFVLSDVTGRQVATCRGDRVGEGLRPGVYFISPVGLKTGNAVTATIVKTAF